MRKRDGGKFSFLRKGDGSLQINLSNFFKDIDIIFYLRKRDGGKISFLRKRDGPLWINLKFFKDTEEYLDKQDAF